jgi:hypothetical protein
VRHAALLGAALGGATLVTTVGCNDLDRFTTGDHEAYCGSITLSNRFREGLSPKVQMRLRLDGAALDGVASPGTLSTFEAPDEEGLAGQRLLDESPLRVIEPLTHDPLSDLEFGEGRDKNALLGVSPADPEGESIVAVLSLKADDNVEVRLIRPGSEAEDAPPERRALFGLFPLTRQDGDCGF